MKDMNVFNQVGEILFANVDCSDISLYGLLFKWTKIEVAGAISSLQFYHLSGHPYDDVIIADVRDMFINHCAFCESVHSMLEDMIADELKSAEDDFKSRLLEFFGILYGNNSNEVYIMHEFLNLYENIDNWDVNQIGCEACDSRLLAILKSQDY